MISQLFVIDMTSGGDRSIAYLFRVGLVVCIFLVFGMILNGFVLRKNKMLEQKDHQTSIRISLMRAECERKLGDLRLKYKQSHEHTLEEAVEKIKKSAKQALDNQRAYFERRHTEALKNQFREIDGIRDELKKIRDEKLNPESRARLLSIIVELENRISDLKFRIMEQSTNDGPLFEEDKDSFITSRSRHSQTERSDWRT